VVVAAGNPASERGVHFSMPRPLRNRFVHLNIEPDFEDWCRWAVRSGLRPEIVALLRFKPALLHDANATSDVNAWPTPRSWEMASNVIGGFARRQKTGFFTGATEIEAQLLEGTVGPAATTELVAFLRLFRDLPSIDEILLNPDSAPLPGEPSAQIAIATALGKVLSDHSIAKGTHMVDKLNEPESRFHASLVTNVFDLVDLLPRLNVNDDEELNRFAAEIKDRLCNSVLTI
jgi:hypothetical protein